MNTSNISTPWVPYKIPPCPVPDTGKTYALSFSDNAVPSKNPSQFLQWKEIEANLPEGTNKGDILYWDPAAGDDGAWVVLTAPENATIEIKEFDVCENGQPEKYNMLVWQSS